MDIVLNSGIKVSLNGFHLEYTYGGLLAGRPHEKMNRRKFESVTYPAEWGERKVLKIVPEVHEFETRLKSVIYSAWFDSFYNPDSEWHGSMLVVIWFGDETDGRSIEEIIKTDIGHIDWKMHAEGFYY